MGSIAKKIKNWIKEVGSLKKITWMEAFKERRSASVTTPGSVTSEQEPTEIWLRLRPSPVIFKYIKKKIKC